jgi:plastocyanin
MHGCHTWALNGGANVARVSTRLARGGSITFVNNDVMPHKLIQGSGPAVHYGSNAALRHIGASVKVTFSKTGTYQLKTKAGEDYTPGIKTTGEDNVLRLTVKVS